MNVRKQGILYYGSVVLNGDGYGTISLNNGNPIEGEIKTVKIVGSSASATVAITTNRGRTLFSKAAYNSSTGAQSFALMQPAYTSAYVATTAPAHVPQVLMNEHVAMEISSGGAAALIEFYMYVN